MQLVTFLNMLKRILFIVSFLSGYKESAFAYAISAAGVTHQVAKACSLGKLKSCGCDMSMQGEVRDRFEWGGCSHNVEFGVKYAKRFTNARERGRDIHARINLHNNRAGRLVIETNKPKTTCADPVGEGGGGRGSGPP